MKIGDMVEIHGNFTLNNEFGIIVDKQRWGRDFLYSIIVTSGFKDSDRPSGVYQLLDINLTVLVKN